MESKPRTEFDDTNCRACNSSNITHYKGASGWNFFIKCNDCNQRHAYSSNDMMGGGLAAYHLHYASPEWQEDFHVDQLHILLEEAEKGWTNTNGKIYERYDRLQHTAKNLLKHVSQWTD